ncbi:MAG TPA: hypothetical protein PLP21_17385 [Pyrinomonadaceae bacterium]|nr:hypothetical protein [Acidobacteriota bacterium]HQZ98098.1 hypothetical protein [Pyrinomonadaceae bacterium]
METAIALIALTTGFFLIGFSRKIGAYLELNDLVPGFAFLNSRERVFGLGLTSVVIGVLFLVHTFVL